MDLAKKLEIIGKKDGVPKDIYKMHFDNFNHKMTCLVDQMKNCEKCSKGNYCE